MEETKLRHQQCLDLTPQGQALQQWDHQNSHTDVSNVPPALPPWERPALGLIRRRPIQRRHQTVRKQYIAQLANDKGSEELDIFTDAAISGISAAVAWTCPENPTLNGSRQITNTYGLTDDVELFGILGALQQLQTFEQPEHHRYRIITDSHVALQELNKAYTHNATANRIISTIQSLRRDGIHIRLAWTPGHTAEATGNQQAHNAARECLLSAPPLASAPADDRTLPAPSVWYQKQRQLRQQSQRRLQEATPPGFLPASISISRQGEIFVNKACADAAYTPDIVRKWYHGATSLSSAPTCAFCGADNTLPNLFHLIWSCPTFQSGREQLTDYCPPPVTNTVHLELLRSDATLLERIGVFSVTSGLYKAV